MNNYILEYYQGIKDGSIIVGIWIMKLYTLIVRGLEDGTYIFNQKKANRAIGFVETYCRHSKGVLAPQVFKLSLWQKAATSLIFGIVDENDKRVFREIFIVVARKNGKSLLAAAWLTYEAYIDGEYGSEIYCIAPKLDQAEMVFSDVVFNIENNPEFEKRTKKRKNDYYIEASNTVVKKIAFSDRKSDGYNPQAVSADEISSWAGDRGLKQYEVILSGMTAREEPLIFAISSGGYQNDSIYDELMKRSTRFLNGDSKERRLLPLLYIIDDIQKWDDINELRKSMPGLGVSVSVDTILDQIATASESLSKATEFKTKYCNVKQNSSVAWISSDVIKKCSGPELTLEDFRNSYAVCGIDLSQTTDLTAATAVIEKDGLLYVIGHCWLPEEKLDQAITNDGLPYREYIKKGWLSLSGQNFVDYEDVYSWFRMLIEEYEIYPLKVGYDRYSSQYLVKDLNAYGFHTDDVYQGYNLTGIIQTLEGLLKDGRINIGNNDLLKIHMLDTALKVDTESRRMKIVKIHQRAHIDLVASLLCGLCVREKYYETIGEQLRNEE